MTLVEKFIEFDGWTTSRKTVLLTCVFGIPFHLIALILGHALLAPLDWIDMAKFDLVLGLMLALAVLALGAGLISIRMGGDGLWTVYFWAVPYAILGEYLVYLFGVQSTALVAWGPVVLFGVAILFDARVAWVTLALSVTLVLLAGAVAPLGWAKFAPIVTDRNFDVQQDGRFVGAMSFMSVGYTIFGFTCAVLVVSAWRLQQVRLAEANQKLSEATSLISRYVPAEVAEGILSGSGALYEGHSRRKITVFFSDLVGFSDIAEELEPEDLALVLNEYFSEMTTIARRHHGTVDELAGDALLIFFGAPYVTSDRDHALNAVLMACEMHDVMDILNDRWRDAGITETLRVRMGINTGVVTIGNFGSPERIKYAALGKHVNLAARLQTACEPGRTLMSYATWLLVKDEVRAKSIGELQLKGIHKPVEAYELVDAALD